MRVLLERILSCFLCATMAASSLPVGAAAGGGLPTGSQTAARAAAPELPGSNLGSAGRLFAAFAYADTTEYEFPDEEEEERNVVKEVILWTAVAGFLAFFVIKVFLQGDTDIPPSGGGGKIIPPPTVSEGSSARSPG